MESKVLKITLLIQLISFINVQSIEVFTFNHQEEKVDIIKEDKVQGEWNYKYIESKTCRDAQTIIERDDDKNRQFTFQNEESQPIQVQFSVKSFNPKILNITVDGMNDLTIINPGDKKIINIIYDCSTDIEIEGWSRIEFQLDVKEDSIQSSHNFSLLKICQLPSLQWDLSFTLLSLASIILVAIGAYQADYPFKLEETIQKYYIVDVQDVKHRYQIINNLKNPKSNLDFQINKSIIQQSDTSDDQEQVIEQSQNVISIQGSEFASFSRSTQESGYYQIAREIQDIYQPDLVGEIQNQGQPQDIRLTQNQEHRQIRISFSYAICLVIASSITLVFQFYDTIISDAFIKAFTLFFSFISISLLGNLVFIKIFEYYQWYNYSIKLPFNFEIKITFMITSIISLGVVLKYVQKKNWMISNFIAFCLLMVAFRIYRISSYKIALFFLGLFFFEDIYWVFYSYRIFKNHLS